jgi:hypothetical protein
MKVGYVWYAAHHSLQWSGPHVHARVVPVATQGGGALPGYLDIFDEKRHPLTNRPVPADYAVKCPPVTEIFEFMRAFFKVRPSPFHRISDAQLVAGGWWLGPLEQKKHAVPPNRRPPRSTPRCSL